MNLATHYDPDEVPAEWWLERMRLHRDALLAASDWTQTLDAPLTDEQRQAWATYRQHLRDAPSTWTPGPQWDAPDLPGELTT